MAYIEQDCQKILQEIPRTRFGRVRQRYAFWRCKFHNAICKSFYDQMPLILPFGKDANGNNDGSMVNYGILNQNRYIKAKQLLTFIDRLVEILINRHLPPNERYSEDEINPILMNDEGIPDPTGRREYDDYRDQAIAWFQAQPPAVKQFVNDMLDWMEWKIRTNENLPNFDIRAWLRG